MLAPDFRVWFMPLLTGCRYQEAARLRAGFSRCRHTAYLANRAAMSLTGEGQRFFAQLSAGRRGLMLGRQWAKSSQAKPMAAACARAGIIPAVGLHQLRHTYASLAVMNGTPLMVVAHALGHSSTRMVERHYGHLS
jgi:integrase